MPAPMRPDDRRRGALDDGRHDGAGQKSKNDIVGQLAQKILQGRAGALFQAVAHDFHAVEEHCQAAQQGNDHQNCTHNRLPLPKSKV